MSVPPEAEEPVETMPIVLSWSGGKDAAWTLHALNRDPRWRVVALLTTVTEGYERVAMQGIRRDVLLAQTNAAGLPLIEAQMPQRADNATYERCFAGALEQARERFPGLRHIAFGDLFLEDIRQYRYALCARLDWTPVYPLFGSDTRQLAREMLDGGLKAALCCVDTTQLDARFAGRTFDESLLDELPDNVDPCGENGEFHTCVHAGPFFDQPLYVEPGEQVLRDQRFMYADLTLSTTDNQ
ncbi:MAG: ATP-binding protein [Lysobacteraceae bacterium]